MPYGQKEERVKAEPIRKTRLTTSQKIKIALKCLDVLIKKYSKSFYDSDELKAIGNAKIGEIIHKTKTNDIEKFKGFICISLVNAFRNYIRDEKRKALCYKRIKNKEEVSPYIGDESNNKSRIKLKEVYIILEDLGVPYQFIDSKEWQRKMLPSGLHKEELKEASYQVAKRLFPHIIFTKEGADSLLIAEYTRRFLVR